MTSAMEKYMDIAQAKCSKYGLIIKRMMRDSWKKAAPKLEMNLWPGLFFLREFLESLDNFVGQIDIRFRNYRIG